MSCCRDLINQVCSDSLIVLFKYHHIFPSSCRTWITPEVSDALQDRGSALSAALPASLCSREQGSRCRHLLERKLLPRCFLPPPLPDTVHWRKGLVHPLFQLRYSQALSDTERQGSTLQLAPAQGNAVPRP